MNGLNDSFVRITELIGEMAWGVELPHVFNIEILKPFPFDDGPISDDLPIEKHALSPISMKPIFEAIYQKLKKDPVYNPLPEARQENHELRQRIKELEDLVKENEARLSTRG